MLPPDNLFVGLFHQAGLLSGNEMKHSALWGSTHDHLDHLEQVAVQANCTTEDTSTMVDCLRQVPSDVLYPLRFDCNVSPHPTTYVITVTIPANTKHLYNTYTMLDQRRRRWADVV